MGINPETNMSEGADGFELTRRQHPAAVRPGHRGLPGALAHIEDPRDCTEQERSIANRALAGAGSIRQGTTGAGRRQRAVEVGPSHSSEEAREVGFCLRAGGAKGRAEQGFRWRAS